MCNVTWIDGSEASVPFVGFAVAGRTMIRRPHLTRRLTRADHETDAAPA
jgi:hypothetical protein